MYIAVAAINFFRPPSNAARMHVDAVLDGKGRCVVDRGKRAPNTYSTGVQSRVEV